MQDQPPQDIETQNINQQTEQTIHPSTVPMSPPVQQKSRKLSKKTLIIIILVALLVLGALSFYFIKNKKNQSTEPNKSENNVTQTSKDIKASLLDKPEKLDDLKLIDGNKFEQECHDLEKQDCEPMLKPVSYFKIGTTKNNEKIIVISGNLGSNELSPFELIALTKDDSKYTILSSMQNKDNTQAKELEIGLTNNVTIDNAHTIPELIFKESLNINGETFQGETIGYFTKDGHKSIINTGKELKDGMSKKIDEQDSKTIYEVTVNEADNYSVVEIIAAVNNVYANKYNQANEIIDKQKAPEVKWTKGEQTNAKYYSAGAGCGSSSGYIIAKNIKDSDLTQVGTTKSGVKLYQLPNSNALVKDIYETDYNKGELLAEDSAYKSLSMEQFTNKHGYFLAKNGLGQYVVYLHDDMIARGGCGKPVIYLYPQKDTNVSVKVGADVTVSDPLYPKDGWQNVLARPDGQLSYRGKLYGSLFWEGQGHGKYPAVRSGTIVPRSQAIKTMEQQLKEQGLQGREISEFIEFWGPNVPNKPYIRLTWFGNSELDRLAPLSITPRPQTVIRTFLDMDGLDRPYSIEPQTFKAQKRQGFTVVEWGGLARNGLGALVR